MATESSPAVVPELTLGWRMKLALRHAGMSVDDIAKELGVARGTVTTWTSDRVAPRSIFIRHWALITGVDYDWLATGAQPNGEAAA
jgi:transcriptional regulator with XRE-family HTH domain